MPKVCKKEDCNYNVFGKGYCRYHQYLREDKKKSTPKKRKLIYRKVRDEYKLKNPICEFPGCRSKNIDLHHKAKRGKNLSDPKYFMSVCRKHHEWIHYHPKESREMGYLIS